MAIEQGQQMAALGFSGITSSGWKKGVWSMDVQVEKTRTGLVCVAEVVMWRGGSGLMGWAGPGYLPPSERVTR